MKVRINNDSMVSLIHSYSYSKVSLIDFYSDSQVSLIDVDLFQIVHYSLSRYLQ